MKKTSHLLSSQRGAMARSVAEIPLSGWLDVLKRLWHQIEKDNVFLISAGVAFYFLLALVPGLTALAALGSPLIAPDTLREIIAEVGTIMPESASVLLTTQLDTILTAGNDETSLTLKVVVGFAISIWAAAAGIRAMMIAVTVAYREEENRPILEFYLKSMALMLAAFVIGMCAIFVFVAIPLALSVLALSNENETLLRLARWPFIIAAVATGLAVTYRFAPARRQAKTKWVTTGAIVATLVWVFGSLLFTTYVERIADYEALHGTLSSIVVLLLWFWFSAFVTIMGAELNAEIEHQTCIDTTIGRDRPMGQRGAYVADHIAPKPAAALASEGSQEPGPDGHIRILPDQLPNPADAGGKHMK